MTAYYTLYAQNMISSPVTTSTKLGITGDENTMRIGDQVLRITALSKLNIKIPIIGIPLFQRLKLRNNPVKMAQQPQRVDKPPSLEGNIMGILYEH